MPHARPAGNTSSRVSRRAARTRRVARALCVAAALALSTSAQAPGESGGAPASQPAAAASRPASRPADELRYFAARVAESVNLDPPGVLEDYSDEFLLAFPFHELRALFADFRFKHGPVRQIEELKRANPRTGVFRLVFERKVGMRMELMIAGEPTKIVGLRFSEGLPAEDTREKALFAFESFGPASGCALLTISPEGETKLFDGARPERRFAVAGAVKLYVLGALVDEIAAGKRKWSDVVALDGARRAYPAGRLAFFPAGSPLTLHSLAAAMLADDDDTAAEMLTATLGREKVEAMLGPMGVEDPAARLPLVTPRESFLLKNATDAAAAERFAAADVAGKRALLAELAKGPTPELAISRRPRFVGTIGFVASAEELCRALAWLHRRTESGPAADARELLGLNRGFPIEDQFFTFAGYKGGAEPGAQCGTWLLRRPDGRWFAFAAGWNDAENPLDEKRFMIWVQRYLELCAATL